MFPFTVSRKYDFHFRRLAIEADAGLCSPMNRLSSFKSNFFIVASRLWQMNWNRWKTLNDVSRWWLSKL
jgi:hypothetical protein